MDIITCGIDLHYEQSNFYFIDEATGKEFYRVVPTNRAQISKMLDDLQDHRIQYAFETGTMARFLYGILSRRSNTARIHVVHPKKFKVIVESKHKNDKIDSKKLAEGLSKDYLPMPVYMKSERCRRLQMLLNLRRSRVKNKVTAASLLAKIDIIDRFKNADALSSYLGLVPSEHSSGQKISHGKITKEGNTETRWLLIQSAWTLIRLKKEDDFRGSALRKKFYRIAMKEKNTQKAIVAIARHMTRIVYGVMKSKTPYSGEIDA